MRGGGGTRKKIISVPVHRKKIGENAIAEKTQKGTHSMGDLLENILHY